MIRTVQILVLVAFLVLWLSASITTGILCPNNCDGIACEPITPKDCSRKGQFAGQFRYEPKGGICQCCPYCVQVIGRGQDCSLTLVQPRSLITSKRAECEPGTRCNLDTLKCI